jgi:hypothetical protein
MTPAASSESDRLRKGATRWTDVSALRQAMRGVTGTASPAARLAAVRLARGAVQRDRRSDEEGRLYALLAAGYVLGHSVIGSAPDLSADAGSTAADGAVRRLREIEKIGLSELIEAAGSTAGAVARELVDGSGARSPDERRRAAWAVSVGIGLAATDGPPGGGEGRNDA